MAVKINRSRNKLLSEIVPKMLEDRYLIPGETDAQDAFKRVAETFAEDDAHAQRIYDYMSKLWLLPSTPVLANGGTKRGMPISCFLNYMEDSITGIMEHYTENAHISKEGGGLGGYISHLRPAGSKTSKGSESTGIIPFLKVIDSQMLAFSQGVTRRGSYASYIDINHSEIEEFLDVRKPTGGDINRKSTNLHHGVVLSEEFMQIIDKLTIKEDEEQKNKEVEVEVDDSFELIDPHTKKVTKVVSAGALWIKIMENRISTGEPYVMWGKAVNDALPESLKAKGLKVHHSNLCTEITLPATKDRTAVCCLSSVNLEKYDEWAPEIETFLYDIVLFLDNVLQYFIDNAPPELSKAVYSAVRERSIGIGTLGFHAYLQSKNICFEGVLAKSFNIRTFKSIKYYCEKASIKLGELKGNYLDAEDLDHKRNSHLLSIAPNASSGIIADSSPSIEPFFNNCFERKTKSGAFMFYNKYLKKILKKHGIDNIETWKSIASEAGSVQHIEELSEQEKEVFKTAFEIDQKWIISHAADRQLYICQGQSTNLFFPSKTHIKKLHNIHMTAWKRGIKTLYYLRTEIDHKADNISKPVEKECLIDYDDDACLGCEG